MIRIATVGYLNAAPLVVGLDDQKYSIHADIPAIVAEALREGEADVALTPVVSALDDGDFRIVGGVAIGSEGPVFSVVLVAETEPEEWEEIVLDGESRTSAVLTQVLLRGPLADRCSVKVIQGAPGVGVESARGRTAALVIGDAAMDLPDRLRVRLDLGELWTEWTGLPFVFAVWAGRPDLPGWVREDLRRSAEIGLTDIPNRYDGAERDYLLHSIRYTLDDRALMGLRRFAALAYEAGLLASRDVRLYGPTVETRPRDERVDGLLGAAANGDRLSASEIACCARYARLSDLGAAANLKSGISCFPVAPVQQRIDLNLSAQEAASLLRQAEEERADGIQVEGLNALERSAAQERVKLLHGRNMGLWLHSPPLRQWAM